MAKFALMVGNGQSSLKEFEGDYLDVNGDNVLVMGNDGGGNVRPLHVVRMIDGWVVTKIGK